MKVNEIFRSIQGEGLMVGIPMNFVRFCQCNLSCEYCDTDFEDGEEMGILEITEKLNDEFKWVSLTGGEPMLEENLMDLINEIKAGGFKILLETNGTIFNKEVFDGCEFISVDIKGPSSGDLDYSKEVFDYCLGNSAKSQLKFVIKDMKDFEFFQRVYRKEYPNWILQPEFGSMKSLDYDLIMNGINDNVRIIPQVHRLMGVR
ncbi:MAG: 7-carboxy-7-deazaguanine synthase QueE [Candidatus Altiarchaeales archaeon]|nr:7-carboxy-7-deazaguanine synthase QueE [Candidatus Altiarchaeota archaeon]MBU4341115.1 7-carboxy-7-deazaguanine synthase QueE [Candidatus Altiarchaeota archaeon]MBU4437217.1 7-carboxy-7-deazaguanine synthase QueE [Candidatus Altiarchaeota archaeon]MCG2782723.1 7-carboxy-7-deazaguanine synthase QueE [Candidatus Altiarchaeales archaeon]